MRQWLVDIRKQAGMTQKAVAEQAGISQPFYAAIETGKRGNPLKVPYAKAIAAVLGFGWEKFYEAGGDTHESESV